MPRLSQLEDVVFPVEEHPVFVSYAEDSIERRLAVPGKKAIVNGKNHRVLGIVSRDYRLVNNAEALEMALTCCRTAFPETKPSEWQVKTVDAPSTAGYCHLDLVHNTNTLDFGFVPPKERPEIFGPFIRVTNSYNGLRALAFDIGFYRKVCSNGLIIPETIIRFKFDHTRRDIGKTIEFEIDQDRLAKFKTDFNDALAGLRHCAVQRTQFEPLIRGVLLLQPPQPGQQDSRLAADWRRLGAHLSDMSTRYADELGENAYAAFNAITEFASRPPQNRCLHRSRHSLQRIAGSWLTSFNAACRIPDFSMDDHLAQLSLTHARDASMTRKVAPPILELAH